MPIEKELDKLKAFLTKENIWHKCDHSIKYETFFKTGGLVKVYITPQSTEALANTIAYLYKTKTEYKIIGFTSNIILFDEIEYSVIISTKNLTNITIKNNCIDVGCGYSLQDFVRIAVINGAPGFEGLEGIPGSIGGAVFMNAGAYGYCISDHIISIDYLDTSGTKHTLLKEDCGFNYRASFFKNSRNIIVSARFDLQKKSKQVEITKNIEIFHIARHSYQEFSYPNLGSMFSVKSNFYEELIKNESMIYKICYYAIKLTFKNPISKFLNRKRPSNAPINWLILKKLDKNLYTPSKKGMNIYINDGKLSTRDSINYIIDIKNRLGDKFHIENEAIFEPAFKIDPDFHSHYIELKKALRNSNTEVPK